MKIKTQNLTSAALDWAVAKASQPVYSDTALVAAVRGGYDGIGHFHEPFSPSTNWAHGGPIVERMLKDGLLLQARPETLRWAASVDSPNRFVHGPTALIAAMRCYVTSKLGDEVEVPEVLALCRE